MKSRIRIKDIALQAGVSPGTVDRVIHNRGNVSPTSKEKVLEALKELDYTPNIIASALAYNKTWKMAAIMPIDEKRDPFWDQMKDGILAGYENLKDYGVQVDFYHFAQDNIPSFVENYKKILESDYHVVIITPIFTKESLDFFALCNEKRIPCIQLNTCLELEGMDRLSYIGSDSYQAGMLSAKLLGFGLSSGEKVMMCHLEESEKNSFHLIEKESGFKKYFENHKSLNIEVVVDQFFDPYDHEGLKLFMSKILLEHPKLKGVFVTNSRAYKLVKVLNDLGRNDLKIVGCDLLEENLGFLEKEEIDFIVNQNPYKQGYFAVMNAFNLLVRKIKPAKIQHLPLDVVMKENMKYYVNQKVDDLVLV